MTDYTVRSDPERLIAASEEISKDATAIKTTFSDMNARMKRTTSYWTGDAAELHRNLFNEQIPKMEEIIERFNLQAEKLRQISGNYVGTQSLVKDTVEELPNNVII